MYAATKKVPTADEIAVLAANYASCKAQFDTANMQMALANTEDEWRDAASVMRAARMRSRAAATILREARQAVAHAELLAEIEADRAARAARAAHRFAVAAKALKDAEATLAAATAAREAAYAEYQAAWRAM